jgi:ornithine cyclodeaminase/alanine dehydrogenase-like protein (mu-crystallin family)
MTLALQNAEIKGLLTMAEYVEAVEAGYREIGNGRGTNFPRENLWIPGDRSKAVEGGHLKEGTKGSVKFKGAALPGLGGAGVQAYTVGLSGGLETFLFLFDTTDGSLAAIMEVLYYDWLKTAATSAVATDYLAPQGSSVVGLIGTGRHARSQLHGLCEVRPVERVQAYSRRPDPREEFCRRMSEELGINVVPVDTPAAALAEADIVTTITTSEEPVFDGTDLPDRPIHINAMGAHYPWVRELDEHVIQRSRIVVDEWEQAMTEQGAILMPIEGGQMEPSDVLGDLGDAVTGSVVPREPGTNWTVFLSGGTGTEDVAVGTELYDRATERGVGTEIAFNQSFEFEL